VRSITIEHPSDADQRIDKFLKKYLPEAPLGGIYKWLRTGKIKVNRKKVEQIYRIELGDVIDIYLHEEELEGFLIQLPTQKQPNNTKIALEILYEDESLLIVNKPPGMNVHP
jgi:23S rRNA pseudouridine955/2504/2580 synthase